MQIAISQTIKNECKDYFYITLGLLLYTFGWTIFLLPYQIVTGGVTALAFAAVLAAVSSGVMQTGNVYDQADEYRMLALEGTDMS